VTDFEAVFRENNDYIFRYLIKLTGDISLAEELTQETFFRAYMNYAGLRNKEKAPVWLCQIAKNTYYAWYNDQKKKQRLDEKCSCLPVAESVEEMLFQKELSQKAMESLHRLEEPYKAVFKLYIFGGCTLNEISRIFEKSESWARVTFYRAKQKLAEKMRE